MIKEIKVIYADDYMQHHAELKAKTYTYQYGNEPDALRTAALKVLEIFAVLLKGGLDKLEVSC